MSTASADTSSALPSDPPGEPAELVRLPTRREVPGTDATRFAAAVRGATGPVVVVADEEAVVDASTLAAIGERFRAVPALEAIALAPPGEGADGVPPLAPLPALARAVPAAVAFRRRSTGIGLGRLRDGRDDPWIEVVERLQSARAGVEWRTLDLARRTPPPVPEPAAPGGLELRGRLDPGLERVETEPSDAPLRAGGWRRVLRLRLADGRLVPARADDAVPDGAEVDADLGWVRAEPFPGGVALADPGNDPLGYVAETGLPGGVALMEFATPTSGTVIGRAGEETEEPWVAARLVGWGLAHMPRTDSARLRGRPVGQVALVEDAGNYRALNVSEVPPDAAVIALIHDAARPGSRPLYRASERGVVVLTLEPEAEGLSDVALLGHLDARPGPGSVPVVRRERAGDLVLGHGAPAPSGWRRSSGSAVSLVAPAPLSAAGRARRALGTVRLTGGRSLVRRITPSAARPATLVVAPWFSVGGADHFLRDLAQELRAAGFPLWAALTYPAGTAAVDNRAEFVPHFEEIVTIPDAMPGRSTGQGVAELVRRHGIRQVLLCGGWQLYQELPGVRALLPGLRIVDQLFNDVGHLANNRAFAGHIHHTVCAYDALRESLVNDHGGDPARASTIYIGVDTEVFRPAGPDEKRRLKRELGLDPDRPLWGYVGRISPEKCLPTLVEALARIDGMHDAQVLIQGGGPDDARHAVERAVRVSGLRIEVRPFAASVLPALRAMDHYVLPSRVEGIPLAVMEAMACGVVPVATAVGGVPELVEHGRTGYLAGAEDPGALAIALLAAARTGPLLRAEMAILARREVRRRMSHEQMVRRYVELLG